MRSNTDALRSLGKYMAMSLGPAWEVALAADDEGMTFHRPFARVRTTTPGTSMARGSLQVEYRQSFSALLYPELGDTAELAALEGERVKDLAFRAFSVGTFEPSMGQHVSLRSRRAHPRRVPLWDYDGVSLDESPEMAEARDGRPRRGPRDHMSVTGDPAFAVLHDPSNVRSVTVTVEVRLSWMRFVGVSDVATPAGVVGVAPGGRFGLRPGD